MFNFERKDFEKVVDHPLFIQGHKFLIEHNFYPDKNWFRGDEKLLEKMSKLAPNELYDTCKDYPLIYLILCEDPNIYKSQPFHYEDVLEDFNDRKKIIENAVDKYSPAWWCFLRQCQALAVFILFPMMKLLYPDQTFYLYEGIYHTVLLNRPISEYNDNPPIPPFYSKDLVLTRDLSQPCVIDLIGFCLKEIDPEFDAYNFIFPSYFPKLKWTKEKFINLFQEIFPEKDPEIQYLHRIRPNTTSFSGWKQKLYNETRVFSFENAIKWFFDQLTNIKCPNDVQLWWDNVNTTSL